MDAVKILDNRNFGKVIDELKLHLEDNGQIKIISNKLSIFAFQELKRYLQKMSDTHILLYDTAQDSFYSEMCGGIEDRYLRNKLATKRVAQEFCEWLENKCKIREQNSLINQNMFLVGSREALNSCIMGSSPFSTAGLGVSASSDHHMNTCFSDNDKVDSLQNWFDSLWNTSNKSEEIKQNILQYLRLIYSEKPAREIYFLTLYNIFKDLVSDLDEDKIIKTQTGIKSTRIWQKLYKFQRDGVLGAISKIERFNGCIIADSVGLGKTFEALAIIKYYELRNDRVLVLCPKKLRENWTLYTVNDKRNIFASDRFNYDVLNHTDLTRSHGYSGEINLDTLNWGNYDLVVIDESHNFRNSPTRKDYSVTRYSKLMNEIIKAGVKTKVLMLSATPVNNRMNDLKNQVAFIVEGNDEALKDNGIGSIEHTLKMAQTRFNAWLKLENQDRTTATLLERLNFDYFKLLDLLTIARSRKHIEKYYDTSEVGKFPERLKPLNIKTGIDIHEKFPSLDKINRDIRLLNLSAYAPLKYVLPQKVEEYSRKYDKEVAGGSVFRQVDREQSLIHLMRVNLFKRMESSIHSFSMTLEKLLEEVEDLLKKVQEHDANDSIEELDIEDIEVDDYEFAPFVVGKKVKVLIKDMDLIRWSQELEEDREILKNLIQPAQGIKSPEDEKLRQIKQLIQNKVNNPINAGNKKVIIFTAFADTAKYIYKNISKWAFNELGIYSALVTGTGDNKTEMPGIRKDLASILTSFSPVSKERAKIESNLTDEIDLLIATDCISEGQNLQDCDYLINYDIHWNPVRIIQRFGRVDRLGSKNDRIQLVNFWPNMELDEYINLEARVSGRMVLLDISATGEENVIEFSDSGKMNDLEYRRKQLERLQDEVVDIEDIEGGISITDLTLNDFRMDLGDYVKEHEDLLSKMPYGAYSVVELSADNNELLPGVIFCLKNEGSHAVSDSTYALSPYYLVYVSDEGSVLLQFTQVKKILDILKKTANSGKSISENAIERLNKKTKNGNDMSHYQNLLGKAIQALTGAAEEKGVESLFSPGGTVMSKNSFKGIDDFEVVSYLILLGKKD